MQHKQKNIFLHYLNYDTQYIYGLDTRFSKTYIESYLIRALKISVLLCKDFCFLPLGFIFETSTTRNILNQVQPFLSENLIRACIRESSIKEFLEKKKEGYSQFKKNKIYSNYFWKDSIENLRTMNIHLLNRQTKIGRFCTNKWKEQNELEDDSDIKIIYDGIEDKRIIELTFETINRFPETYNSKAFIWPSVESTLKKLPPKPKFQFRLLFERIYFIAYLSEYDAGILFDLPFATNDFGLFADWSPLCSYSKFIEWLYFIGLNELIFTASPSEIIQIKISPEMYFLLDIYAEAAKISCDNQDFRRNLAKAAHQSRTIDLCNALLDKIRGKNLSETQVTYYHDERKIMNNYDFSHAQIKKGAFGDNAIFNEYNNHKEQLESKLDQLLHQVNATTASPSFNRDHIAALITNLKNELQENKPDKIQDTWNQIKEGIKTSHSLTQILLSIGKLLGIL